MKRIERMIEKTTKFKTILREIEEKLLAPEITADLVETKLLSVQKAKYQRIVDAHDRLVFIAKSIRELEKELESSQAHEKAIIQEMLKELQEEKCKAIIELNAAISKDNAIKEIELEFTQKSGSVDFLEKLIKMYTEFANKHGYTCKRKGNLLNISGNDVYKYFDSANAVHKCYDKDTSVVNVLVFERLKTSEVVIDPKDVRVDIFYAHGKGGQNINKVETAIRLTHIPTGIVVTCQDERSQLRNKERAYEKLKTLLEKNELERLSKEKDKREKQANDLLKTRLRKFDIKENTLRDSSASKEFALSLDLAWRGELDELLEDIILNGFCDE